MGLLEFEKWSNQTDIFSDTSRMCAKIRGLTPGQRRVCRRNKDHMPAVGSGVKKGINECQFQFKDRRWNCTVMGDETVFGPLTLIASRESAFTHAITAAAVSLSVSRACRDGRLSSCGCSRSGRPRNLHSEWVWGGCGDNLEYGYNNMGLLEFEKWSNQTDLFADTSRMCAKIRGLTPGQRRVCRRNKDHMPAVGSGVKKGINECQFQFKDRRWNCTVMGDETVFGPLTLIASRESAFTHAITAAAVSLSVSRACRDGRLSSCGCSRSGRPRNLHSEWVWGGCGDNLEYGYKFTEGFVDIRERERKVKRGSREQGRQLMNRHNNEAGRRAVIKKSRVTCKCHGVSGSCSLITCWQQLASLREIAYASVSSASPQELEKFWEYVRDILNLVEGKERIIMCGDLNGWVGPKRNNYEAVLGPYGDKRVKDAGDYLRDKYDGATEVKVSRRGKLRLSDPHYSLPTAQDLVYLEDSPNYCVKNHSLGSLGTTGRACNRTSAGIDGCALLCCGRGYNTKRVTIKERCNCKFHWCCRVECNTCARTMETFTCK